MCAPGMLSLLMRPSSHTSTDSIAVSTLATAHQSQACAHAAWLSSLGFLQIFWSFGFGFYFAPANVCRFLLKISQLLTPHLQSLMVSLSLTCLHGAFPDQIPEGLRLQQACNTELCLFELACSRHALSYNLNNRTPRCSTVLQYVAAFFFFVLVCLLLLSCAKIFTDSKQF